MTFIFKYLTEVCQRFNVPLPTKHYVIVSSDSGGNLPELPASLENFTTNDKLWSTEKACFLPAMLNTCIIIKLPFTACVCLNMSVFACCYDLLHVDVCMCI